MKYAISSLQELKEIIKDYSTISFDLFDTLFFRRVEGYDYRKLQVSKRIARCLGDYGVDTNAYEVLFIRNVCFEKSKRITGDEVDYHFFLDCLINHYNITSNVDETKESIKITEEDYEKSIIFLNPEAYEILNFLKMSGKRIIATSDMYLPESSVVAILNKLGIDQFFDKLYVSSACNYQTKHTGWLFQYLKSHEDDFRKILHVGDNLKSDFEHPLINQISACHYHNKKHIRKIQRMKRVPAETSLIEIVSTKRQKMRGLLPISFSFFIKKICKKVSIHDSKKIFLLTRDANFLEEPLKYQMAKDGLDLEVRILHIDRTQSFFLNMKSPTDLKANLFLFGDPASSITLRNLILAMKIPQPIIDEHPEILPFLDIDVRYMVDGNVLKSFISKALQHKNSSVTDYLHSMGVISSENVCLVDIGYSGTTARELSIYLKREKITTGRIDCYYFASNKHLFSNALLTAPPVFLHEALILPYSRPYKVASDTFSWLEPYVLDNHYGPIEGYSANTVIRSYDEWAVPLYIQLEFLQKIIYHLDRNYDYRKILLQLLKAVIVPNGGDVRFVKNLKHCKNYDNLSSESIIKDATFWDFNKAYNELLSGDYWIGGSLKHSHMTLRLLMRIRRDWLQAR